MTLKEVRRIFDEAFTMESEQNIGMQPLEISRFQAFLAIRHVLRDKLYWYAFRRGYTETNDLYKYRYNIKELLECYQDSRIHIMNGKEKKYFDRLNETITIYRAMTTKEKKSGEFGISWTLKKEVAQTLASKAKHLNRSTKKYKTIVYKTEIKKSEAIAFINQRKEFEIIYIKR